MEQRSFVVGDLLKLRKKYPILDMHESLIQEMLTPPPCQFGGDPDCEQCGCIASMGLAAVGHHRVLGRLTAGHLFKISDNVGKSWSKAVGLFKRPLDSSTFRILQD